MGTILNVLLYGIMIMQCYVYAQRYKQYVKALRSRLCFPNLRLEIGGG